MRQFDAAAVPALKQPFSILSLPPHEGLDLEIGAGQGLHAVRYAKDNPDRHLIAVERTHERFGKLAGRFERNGRPRNLTCLHTDAVSFVVHGLPSVSLETVFLLYPNPYPKQSQANLRWYNMPFMALLIDRLKLGGRLNLATNMPYYRDEAAAAMTGQWGLIIKSDRELQLNSIEPRTHFEKKYLERGESCWDLVFEKSGSADKSCLDSVRPVQ